MAVSRGNGTVEIRIFFLQDLDDFDEWASDEEVTRFMTWEAFTSKKEAEEFLAKVVIPHPWFKAICVNGRPIGHVVLKQGNGIHSCQAEMGYAISTKFWNMGFASQAVTAALKLGFQQSERVERIEAFVAAENAASARVLQKCGFVKDGLLRKYVRLKGWDTDCLIFSYVLSHLCESSAFM